VATFAEAIANRRASDPNVKQVQTCVQLLPTYTCSHLALAYSFVAAPSDRLDEIHTVHMAFLERIRRYNDLCLVHIVAKGYTNRIERDAG